MEASPVDAYYSPYDRFLSRPATPARRWKMGWRICPSRLFPTWSSLPERNPIAFTVVGPEAPLAAGIVDAFRAAGLKIFGPTRRGADWKLQGFLQGVHAAPRHSHRRICHLHFRDEAHRYVDEKGAPIVIKADGLAAGKGVVVAMTLEEAHAAVDAMLVKR